jgi:hypothetical protein
MYQSSTRNSYFDVLLDPTAIAILGSIALHAIIAASFPFLFQPETPTKKVDTGSVKVVELTPNELQRIPQAPAPVIPQTLPPVYQPSTPIAPVAPPRTPKISTAPQTIPSSPIRPPQKGTVKPPPVKKTQTATPQRQPAAPLFDPNITFQPSPIPNKSPAKPTIATKPSPQPAKPATPAASPKPMPKTGTDDDNSAEQPQPQPLPATPGKTSQQQTATPQPSGSPSATPGTSTASPPPAGTGGDGTGTGFYGESAQAAAAKMAEYKSKYQQLVIYPPKKLLFLPYPPEVPCSRVKEPPFVAMMAVFSKVPENSNSSIMGESTAPSDDVSIFQDKDNQTNRKIAADYLIKKILEEVNTADKNRPVGDKNKPVLYQYRVQFDPATCKK